jgi:WD40 repeat protein
MVVDSFAKGKPVSSLFFPSHTPDSTYFIQRKYTARELHMKREKEKVKNRKGPPESSSRLPQSNVIKQSAGVCQTQPPGLHAAVSIRSTSVTFVCWNRDCERVMGGCYDRIVKVWDVESGKTVLDIETGFSTGQDCNLR